MMESRWMRNSVVKDGGENFQAAPTRGICQEIFVWQWKIFYMQ